MELENKTELQEQPTTDLRAWVAPAFECVPLNEALLGGPGAYDGIYMGS